MAEMKPRSMRMSDENYTRLQELSEGRSLDETISFLLSTHDKDETRNSLGEQAIKLDELDEFLNAIRSQFAALLHTCQNAKEVVRLEYRKELEEQKNSIESMKNEIMKLQKEQIRKDASAQETIETLRMQLEAAKKEVADLEIRQNDEAKNAKQKQQVIDSLSAALASSEKKVSQLEHTETLWTKCEAAQKELRMQYEDLKAEQVKTQKQLEEKEALCKQLETEQVKTLEDWKAESSKQLAACHKEYQEQIQRFKEQKEQDEKTLQQSCALSIREAQIEAQEQINRIKEEYQNKLFELLTKEPS